MLNEKEYYYWIKEDHDTLELRNTTDFARYNGMRRNSQWGQVGVGNADIKTSNYVGNDYHKTLIAANSLNVLKVLELYN